MAHEDNPDAAAVNAGITRTPGIFPRVPGDLPKDYPEASPPGLAWTIYNHRERRSYWHFGRPAEWAEAVQRDYDPDGLTVAERRRLDG